MFVCPPVRFELVPPFEQEAFSIIGSHFLQYCLRCYSQSVSRFPVRQKPSLTDIIERVMLERKQAKRIILLWRWWLIKDIKWRECYKLDKIFLLRYKRNEGKTLGVCGVKSKAFLLWKESG